MIYRLFKLDRMETACEDYGQVVTYRGTIPDHPHRFVLDKRHDTETRRIFEVCGGGSPFDQEVASGNSVCC